MRFTTYTDYRLRVLMHLGLQQNRLATIPEIADAYSISANHLMKIIHHLGKLGYIETTRGRGGGLKLAGRPEEINLGELVRQVESDFAIVDCFDSSRPVTCAIAPACRLQLVLEKALQAFLEVLDGYTLADLLQSPTRLRSLLKIEPAGAKAG